MARATGKRLSTSVRNPDDAKLVKTPAAKPKIRSTSVKPMAQNPRSDPPVVPPPKSDDYENDIFKYLSHQDQKYLISDPNYLNNSMEITVKMRRIVVDWMIKAHESLDLSPESIHISISMVDRMLEARIVEKDDLQLLAITSLFIATKLEENYLPVSHDYECLAGQKYTKEHILKMEKRILKWLKFDVSVPTILTFSTLLVEFLKRKFEFFDEKSAKNAINLTTLFGELCLLDGTLMGMVPNSELAGATWIVVIRMIKVDGIDGKSAEKAILTHLGVDKKEMDEVIRRVARAIHTGFKCQKLVAVKNKYKSAKLGRPSTLLTEEILEKISEIGKE